MLESSIAYYGCGWLELDGVVASAGFCAASAGLSLLAPFCESDAWV
jgi:hypothetical protein